ncbi:MAG: hypothetical protein ABSG43_28515 [Solirubrobacteraceae bacterium]
MMGLRIAVDVATFEQMVAENQETLKTVEARSKEMGAVHHRFYGKIDGSEVLVVDEWPDAESKTPALPNISGISVGVHRPCPGAGGKAA